MGKTKFNLAEAREKLNKQLEWGKRHPVLDWFLRYCWYRVPDYPRDIVLWIKEKYQRALRGWAYSDIWSFDMYLVNIIVHGLKHFKESCTSHPHELTMKQWNKILNDIIWAFETADKILNLEYMYPSGTYFTKKQLIKLNKTIKERTARNPNTSCHIMTREECKRYRNGWKLLEKWFFKLWD